MSGDTIECFNCGHANPSWAQVCRSCGFALRPDGQAAGSPSGIFPTDQASLITIGGTLGAIVLAIAVGLVVSGLIPRAPNVAEETPTPSPSPSASASASLIPSTSGSAAASTSAAPTLVGTITFGTGINSSTREVTGQTNTFTSGQGFAHSIKMTVPFGVNSVAEEITHVADGKIVQSRDKGVVNVTPSATIAGFKAGVTTTQLIEGWGTGEFVMRVYRGAELLAEGHFTLSAS